MIEIKQLTQEQEAALKRPLPKEALKPHPTKSFLTTINAIYVTERLNEVFGIGAWQTRCEVVSNTDKMVVVKTIFAVPTYGIYYECFGGNDNIDKGDAHKGAVTDAITKVGSWLGIGADVWKNKPSSAKSATTQQQAEPTAQPRAEERKKKGLTLEQVKLQESAFVDWLFKYWRERGEMPTSAYIREYYVCDDDTIRYLFDKLTDKIARL